MEGRPTPLVPEPTPWEPEPLVLPLDRPGVGRGRDHSTDDGDHGDGHGDEHRPDVVIIELA